MKNPLFRENRGSDDTLPATSKPAACSFSPGKVCKPSSPPFTNTRHLFFLNRRGSRFLLIKRKKLFRRYAGINSPGRVETSALLATAVRKYCLPDYPAHAPSACAFYPSARIRPKNHQKQLVFLGTARRAHPVRLFSRFKEGGRSQWSQCDFLYAWWRCAIWWGRVLGQTVRSSVSLLSHVLCCEPLCRLRGNFAAWLWL